MNSMSSNYRSRSPALFLENLESRVLLHGLTIITHGYQPISNDRPEWITQMGNAIRARTGPSTAIYTLKLEPLTNSTVQVTDFSRLAGPSPDSADSDNAETVLLLDWAAVSGVVADNYSVGYLATVVTPYLLNTFPNIGIDFPLAEGSIQLMGHSRGAPFVSEIARGLAQQGIWVDQLTLFDPQPVGADPDVELQNNTLFVDNYYQRSGNGITVPNGEAISGAFNVGPLKLGGAYSSLNGGTHNDVHLFYHGTIDTSANASDGNNQVPASWYPTNDVDRNLSGFYFSRLGGGFDERPASGIGTNFGGTGTRHTISQHKSPQWPNLALVKPSVNEVELGADFSLGFDYTSANPSKVQWYLDPDTNPYNNNSIALGQETSYASTGNLQVMQGHANLTATAPIGDYHLEGRITNGSQSRYSYATSLVHIVSAVTRLVLTQPPTHVAAGATFNPAIAVAIQDSAGNILTDNASSVTIAIASGPSSALGGTTTVPVVHGVASFSDLHLDKAGDYTFIITDGILDPIITSSFTVSPDLSTSQLLLVQQPASTGVGKALAPPLILNVTDQFGNIITSDKSKVALSILAGPAGASIKGTTSLSFSKGTATFSNLTLSQSGTYTLRASDSSLAISTLDFSQLVTPATTTIPAPKPASSYSFGQSISLSTTLKSDAPTSIPFTGNALILDDHGNTLATDQLATNGQAQFKFSNLPPGTYHCAVSYTGDSNHTAAMSSAFILVVNTAVTKVNLTAAPSSLVIGQSLTLTASVTANSGGQMARTGSVSFYDGGVFISTVTLDGNSMAALPIPNATVGKHTYTATYSGDSIFSQSSSAGKAITVNPAGTQTALTYTTLPLVPNRPFTLLAGVSVVAPASGTPTGSITFKEGNIILGVATLNNATASLVISYPAVGTHKITAIYSGSPDSKTSTSLVLTLSITAAAVA